MLFWLLILCGALLGWFIAVFGSYLSAGHDVFRFTLTKWKADELRKEIIKFFVDRKIGVSWDGNHIIASEGSRWWIGKRMFEFTITPTKKGTDLDCEFYLRGFILCSDVPLSKGVFGALPRRMGWKVKMQLFRRLGIEEPRIRI